MVELAKPWPAKIKKVEGLISDLRSVLKGHKGEDVRLIATPEIPWGDTSLKPRGLLLRWSGTSSLCEEIEASPEALKAALSAPPSGQATPLYLVCTHGSRDPCCGLLGIPLYKTLSQASKRAVLQVSHLGGHRFAPVVATFPEWRIFGHLTAEIALRLDSALAEGAPFLEGYRGHGQLSPQLQVVEAALWEKFGADLLGVRQRAGDKRSLTVEAHLKDQPDRLYQAELDEFRYHGYKSCKDYRKGKPSELKLPRLKSLVSVTRETQGTVQ